MKNCNASKNLTARRILSRASATALAVAFAASLAQPAQADNVTQPNVPESLRVQAGYSPFLVGHANGTQNYVCAPDPLVPGSPIKWRLYTPQATLLTDADKQIVTHFFSPKPGDNTSFLPTWQHSRDSSRVWVVPAALPYSDPDFVEPGAIDWLLLGAVASESGPTGGDTLTKTAYIQRVNTSGGKPPAFGCSEGELGYKVFVPYTADYYFYMKDAGPVE